MTLRLPRRVLLEAEVAGLLRLGLEEFRAALPGLRAAGFPPPLPGLPVPRWDRPAIEAWLDRQAPMSGPPQDPLRQAERALIGRAATLGGTR